MNNKNKIMLAAIYLAMGFASDDAEALAMATSELFRLEMVEQEEAGKLAAEIVAQESTTKWKM
jgi:hypothetical protein